MRRTVWLFLILCNMAALADDFDCYEDLTGVHCRGKNSGVFNPFSLVQAYQTLPQPRTKAGMALVKRLLSLFFGPITPLEKLTRYVILLLTSKAHPLEYRKASLKGGGALSNNMQLTAVLEPQKDGGYTAYIPALRGCISEGETLREAKKNLLDALKGYLLVANKHSLAIARKKHSKILALQI